MVSAQEAIEHNKAQLVAIVLKHDIQSIEVEFSGSGDDGCINDINLFNTRGGRMDNVYDLDCDEFQIYALTTSRIWTGSGWVRPDFSLTPTHDLTSNLIEPLIYVFLEGSGVDWINNDGGHGHANISRSYADQTELSFNLEIYQRYTESALEHEREEVWSCTPSAASLPSAILDKPAHPVTEDDFL